MEIVFEGCRYFHTVTKTPKQDHFVRHAHNFYEIFYLYSGDVNYIVENSRCRLSPGDLLFIDCARPHYVEFCSDAPYERAVIDFDASVADARLLAETVGRGHVFSSNAMVGGCFERLDRYAVMARDYKREILTKCVLSELLSIIAITKPADKLEVYNTFLTEALYYIEENLVSIRTLDEISHALYVSPSYLHKTFVQNLKISPMQYVRQKRLRLANRLIEAGEKPTEVFAKCGFCDYSVFYRAYKAFFGCKPSGR